MGGHSQVHLLGVSASGRRTTKARLIAAKPYLVLPAALPAVWALPTRAQILRICHIDDQLLVRRRDHEPGLQA